VQGEEKGPYTERSKKRGEKVQRARRKKTGRASVVIHWRGFLSGIEGEKKSQLKEKPQARMTKSERGRKKSNSARGVRKRARETA